MKTVHVGFPPSVNTSVWTPACCPFSPLGPARRAPSRRNTSPIPPITAAILVAIFTITSLLGTSPVCAQQPQQPPINICLVGSAGWSECDASQPSETYTGLDVELFRSAAARAGWKEGSTYQFVCRAHGAGWSALARQLTINGTQDACAAGSGAFALSSTRQSLGLQFSYPYYRTGLAVVVPAGSKQINYFAFLKPFTWEVWAAFLLTIVFVPLLAYLVEQLMTEGAVYLDRDNAYEAWQATYTSILAVFNLNVYKVRSFAAQCLILGFCFLVMITMATYIANLAAALSNIDISQRFHDVSDLRGRKVAAHSTYINTLAASYGVRATPLDFDGLSTFEDIKRALHNGTMDAYVMDYTEIGYYVMAHNEECSVRLMKKIYALIDLGYLFHKYVDPVLVTGFNQGLFRSLEANTVEQLESKFLLFLGALEKCSKVSTNAAIEFKQLAGLWIILGAIVGLAVISSAVSVVRHITNKQLSTEERRLSTVFRSGASGRANSRRFSMGAGGGGQDASLRASTELSVRLAQGDMSSLRSQRTTSALTSRTESVNKEESFKCMSVKVRSPSGNTVVPVISSTEGVV